MNLIPELSVQNYLISLEFYTQVLGFQVLYERPEEGFAFLTLGQVQLMIDQIGLGRTWQTAVFEYPLGRGINFQITVDHLKPILENIAKRQIPLLMEVEERWYRKGNLELGNRQFLIQDPDGYLLRFAEDLGQREVIHERGDN
jgi:catechol 2,3-dioxygenase-like lactoylglutathione lyase family enzyme